MTLVDAKGDELRMPTGFDDFTEKAHADYNGDDLTTEQKRNRRMLAAVMTKNGFLIYPYEWWHFDLDGWEKFPPLDLGFEALRATSR